MPTSGASPVSRAGAPKASCSNNRRKLVVPSPDLSTSSLSNPPPRSPHPVILSSYEHDPQLRREPQSLARAEKCRSKSEISKRTQQDEQNKEPGFRESRPQPPDRGDRYPCNGPPAA